MSDLLSESNSTPLSSADIFRLPGSPRNAEPDFPAVRAVQAHWETLRAGRVCPSRAEVDPKPLAHCLDVMFVAELVAPTVARLRLCGQQLGELLGMEPRGMPLSVFFHAEARVELTNALQQLAQGARVTLPLRSPAGLGQPVIDGVLALMPLTDHEGRITRILGVLETRGPAGRAPRRFNLSAPMRARSGHEAVDTAEKVLRPSAPMRPEVTTPRPVMQSAEPTRAPASRPAVKGRPQLRVIEGGKL